MDIKSVRILKTVRTRSDGIIVEYPVGEVFYSPNIPKAILNEVKAGAKTVIVSESRPAPAPPEDPGAVIAPLIELKKELADLEATKKTLEDTKAELEANIVDLTEQVASLEEQVVNLEKVVKSGEADQDTEKIPDEKTSSETPESSNAGKKTSVALKARGGGK